MQAWYNRAIVIRHFLPQPPLHSCVFSYSHSIMMYLNNRLRERLSIRPLAQRCKRRLHRLARASTQFEPVRRCLLLPEGRAGFQKSIIKWQASKAACGCAETHADKTRWARLAPTARRDAALFYCPPVANAQAASAAMPCKAFSVMRDKCSSTCRQLPWPLIESAYISRRKSTTAPILLVGHAV